MAAGETGADVDSAFLDAWAPQTSGPDDDYLNQWQDPAAVGPTYSRLRATAAAGAFPGTVDDAAALGVHATQRRMLNVNPTQQPAELHMPEALKRIGWGAKAFGINLWQHKKEIIAWGLVGAGVRAGTRAALLAAGAANADAEWWISAGLTGVIGGGVVGGAREWWKQKEENRSLLTDHSTFKEKFKSITLNDGKKFGSSIAKGSFFGFIGATTGVLISDIAQLENSVVGQKIGEGFSAVKKAVGEVSAPVGSFKTGAEEIKALVEKDAQILRTDHTQAQVLGQGVWTPDVIEDTSSDAWKLGVEGGRVGAGVIEAGRFSPEIEITRVDAQDWIKGANDSAGDYAKAIQGEVGANLAYIDYAIQRAVNNNLIDPSVLKSPVKMELVRDHLLHIMEVHANEAYDSNLERAVNDNVSLDDMKKIGKAAFDKWLGLEQGQIPDELIQGAKEAVEVHDQINQLVQETIASGPVEGPAFMVDYQPDQAFNSKLRLGGDSDIAFFMAENYDVLNEGWYRAHPQEEHFPVHMGQIMYYLNLLATSSDSKEKEAIRKLLESVWGGQAKAGDKIFYLPQLSPAIFGLLSKLY